MSEEQWQCSCCNLLNTYKRDNCQACFKVNKSPRPELRSYKGLHRKIKPREQLLKNCLVTGYANSCDLAMQQIVPLDIIQLLLLYYDEIMHWRIDNEEIKHHSNQFNFDEESSNSMEDDKYYSDEFKINSLKMKCSLDCFSRLFGKPGFNSFSFHVYLPFYVQQCELYIESYCSQNDAEYKNTSTFCNYTTISYSNDNEDESDQEPPDNIWQDSTHYMKLDWTEHQYIDFNYHIDVLSITYTKKHNQANYFKHIGMKKHTSFKWYIDGEFMTECRNAIGSQIFFSETFDESNNNWCLRLKPMGSSIDMNDKDRKCSLYLNLLKKPQLINAYINGIITITNSCNNNRIETTFYFGGLSSEYYIGDLFPSSKLFEITAFTIDVDIQITRVNHDDDWENTYGDIFY